MKKIILLFLGVAVWHMGKAQLSCEPDPSVPDTVVVSPLPQSPDMPEAGIQDTACANGYFETVLTFNVPETFPTDFGEVPLTSVSISSEGAIANMPASMDYVCNPPNCVFEAMTKGCVLIFGTPTEDELGVYDLEVTAQIVITGFPTPLTLTLPGDLEEEGHYYLTVLPEGSENCFMVGTQEEFAAKFNLSNRPNPTSGWTQVVVDAEEAGAFDFVVTDIFGRHIHRQRVQILQGENIIDFDGSQLPGGFYLYSISNGREMVARKMAISRR